MNVIIAPKARSDIASILAWTEANFGPQTLKRYAKFMATAIEQIAGNPECAGSENAPGDTALLAAVGDHLEHQNNCDQLKRNMLRQC